MRSRSAFTLIELLVVISVIAILAAMLLPAVGMIRDMANTQKCGNIQRQMQMSNIAYSTDNDGLSLPAVVHSPSNWSDWTNRNDVKEAMDVQAGASWPVSLVCPAVPRDNRGYGQGVYGYNNEVAGFDFGDTADTVWHSQPIDKVPEKSTKAAFADGSNWSLHHPWNVAAETNMDNDISNDLWVPAYGHGNFIVFRHRGRGMIAYWDGHTETILPAVLDNGALEKALLDLTLP